MYVYVYIYILPPFKSMKNSNLRSIKIYKITSLIQRKDSNHYIICSWRLK